MQSKNKKAPAVAEKLHIERVKRLPCSLCDAPPPSEAHEVKQGQWFTSIGLCPDCHRGDHNGLHGRRHMWLIMKMDETDALAVTIRRLMDAANDAAPKWSP
ncbi:hypothetical protein LJR130_003808 [Variovorax sp. LjRoot130]|uniref:hypothetical protein n=1 Tax=unclassified Variovorax TaxID=663243 RepID=UPI003ECD8189